MIKIYTGLITEYNPFHNGHKYHLQKAIDDTKSDGIICVMSGNFMQRGSAALIDKWNRTKIALGNGIDLVLELPLVYSVSSAEHFAFGSVSLLNSLGVVDNIYFGSEIGDIKSLDKIAEVLVNEPELFKALLKQNLDAGLPFHKSRELALSKFFHDDEIEIVLNNSNNILGIEYLKALKKLHSNITPFTLKREGNTYNSTQLKNTFSSATSIRKSLKSNNLKSIINSVPFETYKLLSSLNNSHYNFVFDEDMFKYIKYKLLLSPNNLDKLPDVSEGLDNRIRKALINSNSLEELIINIKSKRYTFTRINRILTQYFIGLENYDLLNLSKSPAPYARVLGFNSKGRSILKDIKKNSTIDIITKIPQKLSSTHLEIDILGTKAYSLLNDKINPMDDYLKSPIIL